MPPMNIIPVNFRPHGRAVECVTGGGRLVASSVTEAPVTAAEGHLGIRPSHVRWTQRPSDSAANGEHWLPATVHQVDAMGEDTLIYTLADGEAITVLERGPCSVRTGDEIFVAFPPGQVHLFHDDGKRTALDGDAPGPRTLATAPAGESAQ
jgi:ABC-type sugar transport system ATPase subunit